MIARLRLIPLYILVASSVVQAHTFTDLGTLGSDYSTAFGVNDSGQVVGYVLSINDGPVNGGPIPVPEPRTYAMLIMGTWFTWVFQDIQV
ncbi:uncharacterized protein NMK_0530 [Novimethylophilus kurashikiensis]|uniref:Uncharacterized protein n=1 Tax=Novimethylophilus kurashikiensis TaxID=1825523 RepID=A0A2R5F3A3_9PROT|nr:hypothetical protein [Novimethylophilus kurashikiensis]GBG12992.1 uncharacterized protein NMK_0530 [Novimethylophilus kurashikiensis]